MLVKKLFQSIILLIFVVSFSQCGNDKKVKEEGISEEVLPEDIVELRADQQKLANIETGSVEIRSINGSLKVNGVVTVAPQNLATVSLPVSGFVKSASLIPGNAVTKGQSLATVESQDFIDLQQSYLEAKNKLFYAEAEYNRHTELYKDDVYSEKNLQEVTSNYKSIKAQFKALEQKLWLIGINTSTLKEDDISGSFALLSPITGYIKTANVNVGKSISPTDVLFEIVNSDKLLLELSLYEKDANTVSVGEKLQFYINNEEELHDAVICQTGKAITSDKTFKVYATVNGTCKNVLPGMYVNAIIQNSGNKVTALPSEAIVSFEDKDYIFVYEKEKTENNNSFTEYKMVQVKKGGSDGGYTEILLPEGFKVEGSKVVIKGAYNLLSAKKNAGEMAC